MDRRVRGRLHQDQEVPRVTYDPHSPEVRLASAPLPLGHRADNELSSCLRDTQSRETCVFCK